MCRAGSEAVRSWWRNRNSHVIDGGNFGAPPNPPAAWSKSPASVSTAEATVSSSTGVGGSAAPMLSASRPAISPAAPRTRAPSSRQACEIAASTWRKLGMPWRGCGG
jgi:hypothetical protein